MQKTTYYDNSSTLFGGYSSYQVQGAAAAAANGFGGYDAPVPVSHHQSAFQSATHLEVDSYQRSACSLQSLGSNSGHQQQLAKTKELNGSCMRPSLPPEHHPGSQVSPPLPPNPSTGNTGAQQPGGSAGASSVSKSAPNKSSNSSSSTSSSTSPSSSSLPPNPTLAKQIFPWMKECRQTTKQKNCSPSNNSGNGVLHYTCLCLSACLCSDSPQPPPPHRTTAATGLSRIITPPTPVCFSTIPSLSYFCSPSTSFLLYFHFLISVFVLIIPPSLSHHHILSIPYQHPFSNLNPRRSLQGFSEHHSK